MPVTRGKPSNRRQFQHRFRADNSKVAAVAEDIINWAVTQKLKVRYTTAPDLDSAMGWRVLGVQEHKIFTLQTDGLVWILFKELASRFPLKDQTAKRAMLAEFEHRLSKVAGSATQPETYATQAAWRLEKIDAPAFIEVLDWLLEQIDVAYEGSLRKH